MDAAGLATPERGVARLPRFAPAATRSDPLRSEIRTAYSDGADWRTRLEGLLAATPNLICAVRGDANEIVLASEAVQRLAGDRVLVGRALVDALPEVATDEVIAAIDDLRRTGRELHRSEVSVWMRDETGAMTQRYFDLVGRPIRARDGGVDLVAMFAQDVTELVIARKTAESASRAKDEFLAMLGHELRNPLAPIRTALELLARRDGGTARLELEVIGRQVEHLVGLVDDLLDISRIDRGKIELRRETVDLAEVIEAAVEMAGPLIAKREQELRVDAPARELWVDGDRARLVQIFANLITNASKYGEPRGCVEIEAKYEQRRIAVRVRDDGAGIPSELLPRIFDLFEQGRRTLDRSMGGLGLGLAIVRSLVRLHGGDVSAASEGVGRGSEFTVRLPAADEPTERTAAPVMRRVEAPTTGAARLRVLVVDDNEDAADLIAVALATEGYETATAHDGASALETAGWFSPHVAVLDLGLPVMDGCELARRLRELPEHALVRLVAVTGFGHDSDRQRAREAGFDAHLLKPIELDDLCDAIEGRSAFDNRITR
ncbi:ATP-binding protein [Sandaracinus amylolyticus]|uniref:histidine kinase n=1 Tax=Sandaracinus amylolyticus TaxID=927083 RepID=A0A0F6YGS6_9BACT|nr:ATP-binding protein [Sandaracinus amylolyticus]AKF04010.1 Chemotaxis protein methyltransferase CheR [Sandaracinus amylolyticus]